jgi:tetratricopeptide (TPR) repeat protein
MVSLAVLLTASVSGIAAQVDMEDLSASGLLTEASQNLSSESYGTALPYLEEYLKRMKGVKEPRVLALSQEVRLKLSKLMAWMQDPAAAAVYLKQYTENLPLYKPREAYLLLAVNLYETKAYEACITAATNALARPEPKALAIEKKEVNYDEMSKTEMGGFSARQLKRIEEKVKKKGGELSEEISADMPDPEPDYTSEELVLLNMTLAESYTALKQWDDSLGPYDYVIQYAKDDSRRGYAIMQMVNALIALERFDDVKTRVVQLYRTNARYDIRVNMALIKAASALYKVGEYDSSLMLYRMIIPRTEMVAYQEGKMNEIRRDTGLPDVTVTVVTNDAGRIETLFGYKTADINITDKAGNAPVLKLPPKPPELLQLEEAVGTLVALPPYEDNVLYQVGRLYAEVGRPWEAVEALTLVAAHDPNGDMGHRAFAESLMVLVDPLKEYVRVETLAKPFLETHIDGLGPRMVAYALTSCYQKQERWPDIKGMLPTLERFVYSDDVTVRQYEGELYFMQAIADMMLFQYEQAQAGFERVLHDYSEPGSVRDENATYWHAVAGLFLKQYPVALSELDVYVKKYPEGNWVPSAVFYSGVSLFGLDRNEEAQERFSQVIDRWPESSIYSDACSMRGDLLAAKGGDLLDAAQADYEKAIATALQPRQDTYPVFQMITMFNLEKRYDEIVATATAYLERRGDTADVAKAAYWIGKTKLAQGRTEEAVEAYRKTIVQYGGDIRQDGVDMIISELANVSRRLDAGARDQLKENLQASADRTESETLRLRLRVLMAKMDRSEIELGKVLIKELPDLTQAPPPVLSVICDASFAAGDYSRSKEILDLFKTRYDDSDFMRAAFKLRTRALFEEGALDAAMAIVAETQALYGTEPDMAWAQLIKGEIELKQNRFDAARETFRAALNVREWRGAPYAEATYYIGRVEEAAGDSRKAFGWYQRCYVQYKGYAKGYWAAESYLASARCLQTLGLDNDRRNTFRAMLFDKYMNQLPQADIARAELGAEEVLEIVQILEAGTQTNLTVSIEGEGVSQ